MESVNDYITNIISQDIHDDTNWGNIVSYCDFNGNINKKIFHEYLNYIILNNSILQKNIIKKNNKNYFQNITIDIKKYYSFFYCHHEKFDKKIYKVLNKKNNTNWYFQIYIDKHNKKFRLFFTINHAYADGYKILSITTANKNNKYKNPDFKRYSNSNNNYYILFIGTIILLLSYLKILANLYILKNNNNLPLIKYNKTNYIKKTIDFNTIKNKSNDLHITLNDLLYSISIKTHYHYYKASKNILIASPFNTGNNNSTNNFCFLFTQIKNNMDKNELIKTINTLFNYYKYSLFIPLLTIIYSFMGTYLCHILYSKISDNLDILYTNMIGPNKKDIHDDNNNCNLFNGNNIQFKNAFFIMNHKKNELTFNIVSYDNYINIIISFQDKLYNKNKLIKALDNAYIELIK